MQITPETLSSMALRGAFVAVHVRRPTLRTAIRWKDLGMPHLDDANVSAPSTKPPSESYNTFTRLESRLRNVLAQYSAGSAGGFRFMKWSAYEKFCADVEPIRAEYLAAVEPFLAHYDRDVAEALALWGVKADETYDRLESPEVTRETFRARLVAYLQGAWGNSEVLRDKFDVKVDVLNFTLPTAETMRATPELVREARERAEGMLTSFFDEAQNELRASVLDAVDRLHEVLANEGKLTERSITPIHEMIQRFKDLSIVDDREFAGVMARIEATIHGGAERMRTDAEAWGRARETLREVSETARANLLTETKRPARKIRDLPVSGLHPIQ